MFKRWVVSLACLAMALWPGMTPSRAQTSAETAPDDDGMLLRWEVPGGDCLAWNVWPLEEKPGTTAAPADRVVAFGRSITPTGEYTGRMGWLQYGVSFSTPPFFHDACPQFKYLAWLPGERGKPGDTWTHAFPQWPVIIEAKYTFQEIAQVPNADPATGTHPEAVITGVATASVDPQYKERVTAIDFDPKACTLQWSASYDPARKAVTGGWIDADFRYTIHFLGKEATDTEHAGNYTEVKETKDKPSERTDRLAARHRFSLKCWLTPAQPEYQFAQERQTAESFGLEYLRKQAKPSGEIFDGAWSQHPDGQTALAIYTLLKCGAKPDEDVVLKGLDYLLQKKADSYTHAYTVCLTILAAEEFLHQAGKLMKNRKDKAKFKSAMFDSRRLKALEALLPNLLGLLNKEYLARKKRGWGYMTLESGGDKAALAYVDNSNMQFVALALTALRRHEVKIPLDYWQTIATHALDTQDKNGSWNYGPDWKAISVLQNANYNMTCAGLACLYFARHALADAGALDDTLRARIDDAAAKAVKFTDAGYQEWNPRACDTKLAVYYYLYSLERAMALAGVPALKKIDWYRENAWVLFQLQQPDGGWREENGRVVSTCFALLFLHRATTTLLPDSK